MKPKSLKRDPKVSYLEAYLASVDRAIAWYEAHAALVAKTDITMTKQDKRTLMAPDSLVFDQADQLFEFSKKLKGEADTFRDIRDQVMGFQKRLADLKLEAFKGPEFKPPAQHQPLYVVKNPIVKKLFMLFDEKVRAHEKLHTDRVSPQDPTHEKVHKEYRTLASLMFGIMAEENKATESLVSAGKTAYLMLCKGWRLVAADIPRRRSGSSILESLFGVALANPNPDNFITNLMNSVVPG